MISVMCPSRGRAEALTRTIESLRDLADKPDQVEVITRIDLNDPTLKSYENLPGVDAAVIGKGLGYRGLGQYYNDCAMMGRGDWLLMWNDDVLMLTRGWDSVIESYTGQFLCLGPETEPHGRAFTIIPAVPRKWYEIIGHISFNSQADAWLEDVARRLDIFRWIDVHAIHDRADITGNNNDATFAGRDYDSAAFYGEEATLQRIADARRILDTLLEANA